LGCIDRQKGQVVTIAGVSLLRFREDGLVVYQRDYWNSDEGTLERHSDWGM
jgi:hypothetical protein